MESFIAGHHQINTEEYDHRPKNHIPGDFFLKKECSPDHAPDQGDSFICVSKGKWQIMQNLLPDKGIAHHNQKNQPIIKAKWQRKRWLFCSHFGSHAT